MRTKQQPGTLEKYTGIGVRMDIRRGLPAIKVTFKDYPAHRAGVKIGDVVIAVDGVEFTSSWTWDQVSARLRGEKGTKVVLTIFRPNTNETLEVPIVRDEIDPTTAAWVCNAEPIRGFGKVWDEHPEVHHLLGCPFTNFRRNEHATPAAVQTFEHGWLLWLETDTVANVDPIYVFFEDDGSYIRYGDHPLVDAHSYAPTPEGFYKVGDRFAKIYWERIGEQGRQRLGHGMNEARDSLGAFQEFENGRMFWAYESDTIYVIYHSQQAWTSFEDTFEAPDEE